MGNVCRRGGGAAERPRATADLGFDPRAYMETPCPDPLTDERITSSQQTLYGPGRSFAVDRGPLAPLPPLTSPERAVAAGGGTTSPPGTRGRSSLPRRGAGRAAGWLSKARASAALSAPPAAPATTATPLLQLPTAAGGAPPAAPPAAAVR
jgi:hypothetical protein